MANICCHADQNSFTTPLCQGINFKLLSHLTFMALLDLASTDLCYLISLVTFIHMGCQATAIGECRL